MLMAHTDDPIFDRVLGLDHKKRKYRGHQEENMDPSKRFLSSLQSEKPGTSANFKIQEIFYKVEQTGP
jgi:hypothetical protein